MSLPDTYFNPFGQHMETMDSIKAEMENIFGNNDHTMVCYTEAVRSYEAILEKLIGIAKDTTVSAMQPLLSEISLPLSTFINFLNMRTTEELKKMNINEVIRKISKFIQTVSDRVDEPFNSEVLQVWAPLFKALFTCKQLNLKESAALLWKRSFGKLKTPLTYPGDLRQILVKMPKKFGIVVPPVARLNSTSFVIDDEAMDGLLDSPGNSKSEKDIEYENAQSSFQFSQQKIANEMADKILMQDFKTNDVRSPKQMPNQKTPPRKRTSKISLLDEDSCDFVKITSTPPSSRKNRLTDRQKEKFVEASRPNTSINYIDEESQSGIQKTEKMKKALTALNFDVGEDSVSMPSSKSVEQTSTQIEENEKTKESLQNIRKTSKRTRKLFNDSPVKVLPTVSSYNRDSDLIESSSDSPLKKRGKSAECSKDSANDIEDIEGNQLRRDFEDTLPQMKTTDRLKNVHKQSLPVDATSNRRSSRILASMKDTSSKSSQSPSSLNSVSDESSTGDNNPSLILKTTLTDISSDLALSDSANCPQEQNSTDVCETLEPNGKDGSSAETITICETITTMANKSPPPTPRTPSILRGSKKSEAIDSPVTERKKNRVHFEAESLPKEISSSPATPHRKPNFNGVVPIRKIVSTPVPSTNSLLKINSHTTAVAFFPTLVDCQDKIDRIIPNLVTLCKKTVLDSARRSLHAIGVKTVGDFAQLSKSEIEKLTWIKGRSVGARNVLSQHEKNFFSERKFSGDGENRRETTDENSTNSMHPDNTVHPILKETDTAPMELDGITSNDSDANLQITSVVESKSNTVQESTNQEEKNDSHTDLKPMSTPKTSLEASQSPASPMPSVSAVAVSSNMSTSPALYIEKPASRKNLAAIFLGSTKPVQSEDAKVKENVEASFVEDSRLLQRICSNLSQAHWTKRLITENPAKTISIISQAAIFFKTVVHVRGAVDWIQMDFDGISNSSDVFSVEKDVDELFGVFTRFARYHNSPSADSLPWGRVLYSFSNTVAILESICISLSSTS